ncbi:hypothetical protein SCHPADRAFT_840528, partial [Schizopora paradoxa]
VAGILAGDPASPNLWNLFLADFKPPEHQDDIELNGKRMSGLAQADDIAFFSTSEVAVQYKINAFLRWCSVNFLVVNIVKSVLMLFAYLSTVPPRPVIYMHDRSLDVVDEYVYVGIRFNSTQRNVFATHYENKAIKARKIANAVLGLESFIGALPPKQGCKLYLSCVDPHLTYGCEIAPDIDDSLLEKGRDVQHMFLRRLLALNPKSMTAVLFTETGIMPLQTRRLVLALRYLVYLLNLTDSHLARCALNEAINLARNGHASWWGDILHVLHLRLNAGLISNSGVTAACLATGRTDALITLDIKEVTKEVELGVENDLQVSINTSPKTKLLRDRIEKTTHGHWGTKTLAFRHYLYVLVAKHRIALTRLLLSDHCLAEEQLRRAQRNRPAFPSHLRLCRFGDGAEETPLHALFRCEGDRELLALREEFMTIAEAQLPGLSHAPTLEKMFSRIYRERKLASVLARYVHCVLSIFDSYPLLIPQRGVAHA